MVFASILRRPIFDGEALGDAGIASGVDLATEDAVAIEDASDTLSATLIGR